MPGLRSLTKLFNLVNHETFPVPEDRCLTVAGQRGENPGPDLTVGGTSRSTALRQQGCRSWQLTAITGAPDSAWVGDIS